MFFVFLLLFWLLFTLLLLFWLLLALLLLFWLLLALLLFLLFLLLRLINLGKQLTESYKSSKKVDKIVSRFPPLYTICKWNEALYSIVKVMVTKTHNRVVEAVSKPDHGFILELGVP